MRQGQMNTARLFVCLLAAYVTLHTALRSALGGAFEVDEAEMIVMAQRFQLGYGPQLPLYNWLQVASFKAFGLSTFAISVLKNALLFLTGFFMFQALRLALPVRAAVAATLVLLLLPNLSWEGQRAGSHSIAMYAALAGSFYVFTRLIQRPSTAGFILFGVVLGLGGLTKYNFWIFPISLYLAAISMPAYRPAVRRREYLISAGLAAGIVALPYYWIAQNLSLALASTHKFFDGDPQVQRFLWLDGLTSMAMVSLAAMILLLLVVVVLRLPGRGMRHWPARPDLATLLLRATAISSLAVVALVIGFNVSDVQPRWLVPVFISGGLGLMIWAVADRSDTVMRNYFRFCGFLALLVLVAIADIRMRGAGSDSLMADNLADQLEAQIDGTPALLGQFYYPGNVAFHRPDWRPLPPFAGQHLDPFPDALVIFEPRGDAAIAADLKRHGAPQSDWAIRHHVFTVPYRFEDTKTRDIPVAIITAK